MALLIQSSIAKEMIGGKITDKDFIEKVPVVDEKLEDKEITIFNGGTKVEGAFYGINFSESDNNTIYNNYFNNTINAFDEGNNSWNISIVSGENILGGPYLGGNFWSDYEGTDTDENGIGDTEVPYNSSNNITNDGDYLPLVEYTEPETPSRRGGGGGSIPPIIGQTINITKEQFLEGFYISNLSIGDILKWTVNEEIHTGKIVSINSNRNYVVIEVSSDTFLITLYTGEAKNIDTNKDEKMDTTFLLTSVYDGANPRADIKISKYVEIEPIKEKEIVEENKTVQELEIEVNITKTKVEKQDQKSPGGIAIIYTILTLIGLILSIMFYIKISIKN